MRVNPGMFYIQFSDEQLEEAIDNHSFGFKSVQEAIDEADAIEHRKFAFVVLNDKLEVVHRGITK